MNVSLVATSIVIYVSPISSYSRIPSAAPQKLPCIFLFSRLKLFFPSKVPLLYCNALFHFVFTIVAYFLISWYSRTPSAAPQKHLNEAVKVVNDNWGLTCPSENAFEDHG